MSMQAINWVVNEERQTEAGPRLCLLLLANLANDQGICWPSHDFLAAGANCTSRTIRSHIATLVKLGLVVDLERKHPGTRFTEYLLPHVSNRKPVSGLDDFQPEARFRSQQPVTGKSRYRHRKIQVPSPENLSTSPENLGTSHMYEPRTHKNPVNPPEVERADLVPGFPFTVEDAVARCFGFPDEKVVRALWKEAYDRGGRDRFGGPIRSFAGWCRGEASRSVDYDPKKTSAPLPPGYRQTASLEALMESVA